MRRRGVWLVLLGAANVALVGSLFVVAARSVEEVRRREVYLPRAEATEGGLPERVVIVDVTAGGTFVVSGRRCAADELPAALRPAVAAVPEGTVLVKPAPAADWGDVERVLRVAGELGARRVELTGAEP